MAWTAPLTVVAAAGTLLAVPVTSGVAQLCAGALAAGVPLVCRRQVRSWVEHLASHGPGRPPARGRSRCRARPSTPLQRPVIEWCAPSSPEWGWWDWRSSPH